ncbi:MAG TPA: peptidylprolyl isomerase [Chloroflexota bacterium]
MRNTPPAGPRRLRSAHESRSATVRAAAAAPSKRQRSHWQREQHQLHLLYFAVGGLVLVVLAIFAGGLIYDNVIRANETVAQIGTDTISAAQLVEEMKPAARRIDAQAKQSGRGSQITSVVDQQKRSLPDQTLNNLIDRHLIQQEADRRGISVSASELDDKEHETVAQFNLAVNPAPTAEATATAEGAPTTVPTPVPTPDLSITPTAIPTLDATGYAPALQQLLDRNNLTEPELRDELRAEMLRDRVEKAIGEEQVPASQEQVHARHILVATEDAAKDVVMQLQAGADFAELAQNLSSDPGSKTKGGDLGWFSRGVMDPPFEAAAFALQPGQRSDVVKGANGYHVIEVLERDPNRPLPVAQLESLRQKAGGDWLDSKHSGSDVKLQLNPGTRDWVLGRIGLRP